MNTNVLELPMYSAASNRKQEFTLRRSPRPGRRWNLQTSSSPSPPLSHGADHPSGHGQPEFPHPEGADGPLRRGRGWGAVGSVHRSLPAGTRKLAESGGTGDRPLFQAMFGKRRLGEIRILRAEARAWNRRTNRNRVTINWTFDRKKARKKFKYKYNTKGPETQRDFRKSGVAPRPWRAAEGLLNKRFTSIACLAFHR